jgi:hypothetical protein
MSHHQLIEMSHHLVTFGLTGSSNVRRWSLRIWESHPLVEHNSSNPRIFELVEDISNA